MSSAHFSDKHVFITQNEFKKLHYDQVLRNEHQKKKTIFTTVLISLKFRGYRFFLATPLLSIKTTVVEADSFIISINLL